MARKIFGPGLVVALILAATLCLNASAETGGHFTTEAERTFWVGVEWEGDRTEFVADGQFIFCNEVTYDGITEGAGKTFTELNMTPYYSKCIMTSDESAATVTDNGCKYIFTIGKEASADNTVHLSCPAGKKLELKTQTCTLSFAPQTVNGVAYTTITEFQKDALTVDVTVKAIEYQRHSGICIFLGTNGTQGEMNGSVMVIGHNRVDSKPAGVKAT
jgi:hypothetical protein